MSLSVTRKIRSAESGITAKYIRNLHDMGMKSLTAAQIVHLREGD